MGEPGGFLGKQSQLNWLVGLYGCDRIRAWIVNERLRLKEFSSFDQEALIGIEISCCERHKYMLFLIN